MTSGELYLTRLLEAANLTITHEKSFRDLHAGKFRYDFYIEGYFPHPVLIEYQGQQHYQFVPKFYKTHSDLLKTQAHDRQKISYALAHNIPLYVIPYWELNSIHSADDIFTPQHLATTRYKNDNDWQQHNTEIS